MAGMAGQAPRPGAVDPLSVSGIVPPTVTAFAEDESLDTAATAAHARFVVDRGVHGVFPLGTNGEFPLLSLAEREQVVEAVVDEVGGEVPVIAGIGAPGTRETVENAQRATTAGADGVVVVIPYYYPLAGEAIVEHYRRVAQAVDCPVYIYHIPGRTGNELSLETLRGLADIDGIAGLKDSSKDVPWLGQAIDAHPELSYLMGSDSLLVPGFDIGCSGAVSAVANVFPDLVVSLYAAYDAGDRTRARTIQSRIYEVRRAIKRGPYLAGVKAALSMRDVGVDPGPLRGPLRGFTADDRATLEADLSNLDLL